MDIKGYDTNIVSLRTVANLQLIYAMRPYEEWIWYLLGFAKFQFMANLLYSMKV